MHPETCWSYVINWMWGCVARIRENVVASFPLQVEASKSGLTTTLFIGSWSWPWSWCFSNLVSWWSRGRNYSYLRQSRANSCQDSNNKKPWKQSRCRQSPSLPLQGRLDPTRSFYLILSDFLGSHFPFILTMERNITSGWASTMRYWKNAFQ